MKQFLLWGIFLSLLSGVSTANAESRWWTFGHAKPTKAYGFERIEMQHKFESSRYEQAVQWKKEDKKPLLNAQKLHQAGILKDYYIDYDHVPIVEIGANFYHLSGEDKRRVVQSTLATIETMSVDRLERQYIDRHNKHSVDIESDFYYMTDNDKFNKLKQFNIDYHRKTKPVSLVRVVDGVTHELIGTYGSEGFFMQ